MHGVIMVHGYHALLEYMRTCQEVRSSAQRRDHARKEGTTLQLMTPSSPVILAEAIPGAAFPTSEGRPSTAAARFRSAAPHMTLCRRRGRSRLPPLLPSHDERRRPRIPLPLRRHPLGPHLRVVRRLPWRRACWRRRAEWVGVGSCQARSPQLTAAARVGHARRRTRCCAARSRRHHAAGSVPPERVRRRAGKGS